MDGWIDIHTYIYICVCVAYPTYWRTLVNPSTLQNLKAWNLFHLYFPIPTLHPEGKNMVSLISTGNASETSFWRNVYWILRMNSIVAWLCLTWRKTHTRTFKQKFWVLVVLLGECFRIHVWAIVWFVFKEKYNGIWNVCFYFFIEGVYFIIRGRLLTPTLNTPRNKKLFVYC